MTENGYDATLNVPEGQAVIYVAGGCFWGTEKLMSVIPGVTDATSGYANGTVQNPSYEQVCSGKTGFRETVRVTYDPAKVSLQTLLYEFFSVIDPGEINRQGNDTGTQYQTGVYYRDEKSGAVTREVADSVKARVPEFHTEIGPLINFYAAEAYHQDYLTKNPGGYCHISPAEILRASQIVVDASLYHRPDEAGIRSMLTPEQYEITQNHGTEPPFGNAYWNHFEKGIYVDVVTGEPLFSSLDKFESSCGWPAFDKPIDDSTVVGKTDTSYGMIRTEVSSRIGNSHLGHVFERDSESPNGTRYCIDSASLKFIPYGEMEQKGYGYLKKLFGPET